MKFKLLLLLALAAVSTQAAVLIKDGKPQATIYVNVPISDVGVPFNDRVADKLPEAELAKQTMRTAVDDLNYHFKKMSNTVLPVKYNTTPSGPAIVLEFQKGEKEEYFIKSTQDKIVISGATGFAVAHGIYEMLSRLGCDWVFTGVAGEVIPKMSTVDTGIYTTSSKPDFAVRCPFYTQNWKVHDKYGRIDYHLWKLRNKMQITTFSHPLVMIGGHVFSDITRIYRKKFKENPDMYALVKNLDGTYTRRGPQIETTDPRVLAILEDYIRNMFKKNKWSKDKKVCIGVGPADGNAFSQSLESRMASSGKIDPTTGNPEVTELLILMCNTLLEKLEKEFPNLHLGFFLYNSHTDFPTKYKPNPKIVLVIADISFSRVHSTLDPRSKTRRYYKSILEKWKTVPNPKFIRGYNWNLAESVMPFSKIRIWADELPYYKSIGVLGVYTESNKGASNLGPHNYAEAQLLWNTKLTWQEILKKYCKGAFGKAAEPMEKYYIMQSERQGAAGMEAGSFHAVPLIYDRDFVNKARAYFAEACKLVDTKEDLLRVKIAELSLNALDDFLHFKNALNNFEFTKAKYHFDKYRSELIAATKNGKGYISTGGAGYIRKLHQDSLEASVKYSSAPYKIVYKIPNKLKTMFDQFNAGNLMGYYAPEINDKHFIETQTFKSTWDAQGLLGFRAGSAWYRIPFPKLNTKTAGLLVGGVDNIVRVWCNGKYIGMGRGFGRPFTFDLTGLLNENGDNLLVIQAQRRGNSEIGTGGIIYPCFIFTGPQLEKSAPDGKQKFRILPGGVVQEIKE
ncbi:MAG: DUF4838 domain-containing protein [Lentisphaeria bacterium]|nr:DUF4838 domain-containing protein [Lentisphaeria bacterium]